MRIKDQTAKSGFHDVEGLDPWGFELHDESRPHMHCIEFGRRSIAYRDAPVFRKSEVDARPAKRSNQ